MERTNKTVSDQAMESEWKEIQAAQQDLRHFRPLYDRYYENIFRFIFRRTADESLSGDICSQVFLKAMQKLGSYSFRGVPFSAWLFRIASNEVTQHFRNVQKQRVVSLDESNIEDMLDELNAKSESTEKEQRRIFLQCLQSLKPSDLQLIELRFFEKRAFREIAAILQITESNAKVKTYRIIERMRKKFKT
ncbi:MAG: sigma-70 family RNA polymerase sigma factor [Bacteroidota bacterium]